MGLRAEPLTIIRNNVVYQYIFEMTFHTHKNVVALNQEIDCLIKRFFS